MHTSLFIFGFGYTAAVLAKRAREDGFAISGTSRREDTRQKASALGYDIVDFDVRAVAPRLERATHILVSTPPTKAGNDPVLEAFGGRIDQRKWIGYLSTTGVYGDHQGAWVDETTPPHPAHGRLQAEAGWQALNAHIFRLAGIYGPGRNVLRQLKEGSARPIYKEGQVFSRIHVEDIAAIVMASIKHPQGGTVYNVCDDLPAASHEVIAYGAALLNIPAPAPIAFAQATLSERSREFYASNRRVKNDKIKKALGITLAYPTYREGLNALLHEEEPHYDYRLPV